MQYNGIFYKKKKHKKQYHGKSARRAEEGLKSRQINHADISIIGCLLLWNPRI